MVITLLFIAVCFLSYANGANDNFKGVASLCGSGAASYRTALTWATFSTLAGSLCALFLAQTLLIKFSGKGLASDELIQSMPFITAVALGAGLTVMLATRLGFPVSTTHALLGALSGSTLSATGTLNLAALGNNFVLPLLLSPFISVLLAGVIYAVFRAIRKSSAISDQLCLCVENAPSTQFGYSMDNSCELAAQQTANVLVIDNQSACNKRYAVVIFGVDLQKLIDGLHFFSAGAVCFARGLNDTPKIAALLLLAPGIGMQAKIGLIAILMAIGGILNARRVAKTMSYNITRISHGQGLSANLTTALLVILASKLGVPVSTTHVSVGAIFGIGIMNKGANSTMIATILVSWLLTLPCAALCAVGVYGLMDVYRY